MSVLQERLERGTAYWSSLWPLLFVPVAAWYSLLQLVRVAGTESPLSFVAMVPFMATFLLLREARQVHARPEARDLFVDALLFLALASACLFLLFFLPSSLSWDYWLRRMDLLVVPLYAAALVILFWGLGGFVTVRRFLLYLLFIWPVPLLWLNQFLAPALAFITSLFGVFVVKLLGLPIDVSLAAPTLFVSRGPEEFTIVITNSCSGMSALLGFLLTGLPLALVWSGSAASKVTWLVVGAAAAFLSNLLRVGIILYLSTSVGVGLALGVVHPVLGAVLFGVVFMGMLFLARFFGLRFDSPSVVPFSSSLLAVRAGFRSPRVVLAFTFSLLMAVGQTGLDQYSPLRAESLPSVASGEVWSVLPELPGWTLDRGKEMAWQNLFGPESRSRVVTYQSGDSSVAVQFVATPDRRSLEAYSPEQCDVFHGETLVGVSSVNLGQGVAARLVESTLDSTENSPALYLDSLYWIMPINVGVRQYYARITVMAASDTLQDLAPMAQVSPANPVVGLQGWLATRLSPYPAAGTNSEFAALDAHTIGFGRMMVEAIATRSAVQPR